MAFPKTVDALREAGYLPDGKSTCKCGAQIHWYKTPNGRRMPMDVMDSGNAEPHWSTCPFAKEFRK